MEKKLKEEMLKKSIKGKISCSGARDIAEKLNVSYKEVGTAADELGIKIKDCQLGCF
jgi:LAO/AO transport system kinase